MRLQSLELKFQTFFLFPSKVEVPEKLSDGPITKIAGNPKKLILTDEGKNELYFTNPYLYYFTAKERECLYWMVRGKSMDMIAQILKLSRKSIERHLARIKEKQDCYTLFQLGEKIALNGLSAPLARER